MLLKILLAVLLLSQIATIILLKLRQDKINKLKKLIDIGKKITSSIKLKRLMKEIMEIAKKELHAEACSLYLVDEEKQELWFEVALGEKGEQLKEIRLKIGEGISGWVAKEGVTLNLKDVNQDPRFSSIGKNMDFKQKAMLTMPVKFQGKTIGVIQLINKIGGEYFTREDEEYLEGMSSQVAIALQNAKLYAGMHDLFIDAISSLAGAIDAKDPYTNGHSQRVTRYSLEIAKEMGFNDEQLEQLEYMALLHDVGKIGVRDSILNKQARLDDEEFEIMKNHVIMGEKILSSMKSHNYLLPGIKYHHEKFDGTGYIDGLIGDDIPIEARIISVADTYDAMTTTRPYRKGLDASVAIAEINKCSGTQFDPDVVKYFNIIFDKRIKSQINA